MTTASSFPTLKNYPTSQDEQTNIHDIEHRPASTKHISKDRQRSLPMASPSEEQSPTIQPPVVFRSNRKRKAGYRQRPGSQDIDIDIKDATASPEPSSSSVVPTSGNHPTEPAQRAPSTEAAPSSAVTEAQADDDPSSQSIAEALRLRNLRKSRLKGVGFRPQDGRNAKHDAANPERGLTHGNQDADAVELGIAGRFAPQTGTVGELVNKHM